MDDKQLLDNAIDYTQESVQDEDWICTELRNVPEEFDHCADNWRILTKDCIIRYFNDLEYKKKEE